MKDHSIYFSKRVKAKKVPPTNTTHFYSKEKIYKLYKSNILLETPECITALVFGNTLEFRPVESNLYKVKIS